MSYKEVGKKLGRIPNLKKASLVTTILVVR